MEVATEEEEEAATAVVATEAAAVVVTEEEEEEIMVAVMADAVEEEAAVTDLTIPLMVEEAEATEAEMEAAEMGVETAEGVTTTKTVEAHSHFFNYIFSPARASISHPVLDVPLGPCLRSSFLDLNLKRERKTCMESARYIKIGLPFPILSSIFPKQLK